jgi:RNA recognition motif-containing protein
MRDRDTAGQSRGFGFVTYGYQWEADAAIQFLHEPELDWKYAHPILLRKCSVTNK